MSGGNRVGLTGSVVIDNDRIINIKNVSSINFRIARQINNCSKEIIKYILNGDTIHNTLIASPPGCGKTTILKDVIRNLSNGLPEYRIYRKKYCSNR